MSNAMTYHNKGLMVQICTMMGYDDPLRFEILLSLTVLLQPDSSMTDLTTTRRAPFFHCGTRAVFSFSLFFSGLFALSTAPSNG